MKPAIHKLIRRIRILPIILFILLTIFVVIHHVLSFIEKKSHPSPGTLVHVNGSHISLSIKGTGDQTIVLLPGLGTVAPILDFQPLADQLSKHNRVVTYEPFGYGYSDITRKERTVVNEVEELRTALRAADIPAPYILMPHSVYGLDAIYYANTYPNEVQAIIGIDCVLPTMTEYFEEDPPKHTSILISHLCNLGVMRIFSLLDPASFCSQNNSLLYSMTNLKEQTILASRMAQNRDIIDQSNHIKSNINLTHSMKFSADLPLLFFTTSTKETFKCEASKTKVSFFESYISNPSIQFVKTYDAPHYMHWTKTKEMSQDVFDFIETIFVHKKTIQKSS